MSRSGALLDLLSAADRRTTRCRTSGQICLGPAGEANSANSL